MIEEENPLGYKKPPPASTSSEELPVTSSIPKQSQSQSCIGEARVGGLDWVTIRLRLFASGKWLFDTRLQFVSFAACFSPRRTQSNNRSQSFGVVQGYIPNSMYHWWSPNKLFFNI